MSTSTNSVQQGEQGLALVAMIIISIILFLVVWLKGTVYTTCAFLHSCWGLLLALPRDFALHRLAAEKYNLLAETAARADSITASEWLDVMADTVTILYAVLFPLGLLLLYLWWGHPSQNRFSRRRVSITTLPHMLAPCHRPCSTSSPAVTVGNGFCWTCRPRQTAWHRHPRPLLKSTDWFPAEFWMKGRRQPVS